MLLTKFAHACVRLEKDNFVLVIDPGSFSEPKVALEGANAILITHEHFDHIDSEVVAEALASNPKLQIFAPAGVAAELQTANPAQSEQVHEVLPDSSFDAAGFSIKTYGGQHALVNPRLMPVANIGYLVDGNLYHPGDSFTVPDGLQVETLLVPIHAPWSKTMEVVDFVTSVRPAKAFQIHDALLSELGLKFVATQIEQFGSRYGVEFRILAVQESVEI